MSVSPWPVPNPGEQRWRRRSLVLLGVLLPLAAVAVSYGSVQRWWHGGARIEHEIAPGGSAEFGGARWQMHAMRMAPLPAGRHIPPNAMGVVVQFQVEVLDADLPAQWRGCAITLVDDQGRRWSSTHALPLPRNEARECVAAMHSGAKPGDRLRIRQAFLVPRDAADQVRAEVALGPQRPHYLRFADTPALMTP